MRHKVFTYILCSMLMFAVMRLPAQDDIVIDDTSTYADHAYDEDEYDYDGEADEVAPIKARDQYFADTINVNHFDKKEWEKIVNGQTFKEEEEKPKGPSFNMPSGPFAIGSQLLKIVGVLLLVIAIVYVLYQLLKDVKWFKRKAKPEDAIINIENLDERLPEKDVLTQLLMEALAKGDYKTAIRFYYLMMIAHFRQKGWIVWTKDKTNRHYLREMRNNQLYGDMKTATNLFESYWYGDNNPDQQGFIHAEVLFKRLLNS